MKWLTESGIRPATEPDFPRIFDIWRKNQQHISSGPMDAGEMEIYREKFRQLFSGQSETFRFLVSYSPEGHVWGWSALFPRPSSPKDAEVVVMVEPEFQGEGLELRLVRSASSFATQTELETLFLQGVEVGVSDQSQELSDWEATPTEDGIYYTYSVPA